MLEVEWGEPHLSEQRRSPLLCHPRLPHQFNTLERDRQGMDSIPKDLSYVSSSKDTELPGNCLIPDGAK